MKSRGADVGAMPVVIVACAILLSVLTACGTPRARVPRPGPALEAQSRLLQQARLAHTQGQHETAIGLLRRFLESYPQSPLLPEARWWLALSYDRQGDLKEALAQYRVIALAMQEGRHAADAQRRVGELERLLGIPALGADGLTALFARADQLPAPPEWEPWFEALGRAGITTLVLEVTSAGPGPSGVYFQTGLAKVHRDLLGPLLPVAHRSGVSVFAALTLRRLAWIEPALGWNDWSFEPARQELQPSSDLDLFHPAFQEYLVALCSDLALTGVDGVVFQGKAPLAATDGLSAFALRAFGKAFGVTPEPANMFPVARPGERADYPPEFWRWAGWRAREAVKALDRLKHAMRRQSPKLRVAVELHPESVTRPLEALLRYGEDLLEAKRARFDYYVIHGDQAAVGVQQANLPGIAEQMLGLLGRPEQIWMTASVPEGTLEQVMTRVASGGDRALLPKRIGLVYVKQAAPVP